MSVLQPDSSDPQYERAGALLHTLTRRFYALPAEERLEFLATCIETAGDDSHQAFRPREFLAALREGVDEADAWMDRWADSIVDTGQPSEGALNARRAIQMFLRIALVSVTTKEDPTETRVSSMLTFCVLALRNCPPTNYRAGERFHDATLNLLEALGLEAPANDDADGIFPRAFYVPFPALNTASDAFDVAIAPRVRAAMGRGEELQQAVRKMRVDLLGVFDLLPDLRTDRYDRQLVAPLRTEEDYTDFFRFAVDVMKLCQVPKPIMRVARALPRLPPGEEFRASGDVVCSCGFQYWEHPPIGEDAVLHQLCDGSCVKL